MRSWPLIATFCAGSSVAIAQPVDPYGPPQPPTTNIPPPPLTPPGGPASSTPTPPPPDPVLAEQVADQVVARAQELFDAKVYLDAKQLAVEAVVTSPTGPAADHARMIIKLVNQQLGIKEDFDTAIPPNPNPTPVKDPEPPPLAPVESGPNPDIVASVHGGMYGALMGAMIGTAFTDDSEKQAGAAVALGIGGALIGAFAGPKLADKIGWDEAQVRTVGAGSVWGGTIGAFIGDIGTGLQGTSARQILISAGIGSTVGALAGAGLASRDKLTRGDVAMVDTFAGIGAVGGITLGMVMQPVESEAYSLNAALGCAGGVLVGLVVAPNTNATPRRMLRVAGAAAAGGAIPFLLYAGINDANTDSDEQVVGLFSSAGLVFGAYLGFRYTRGMDDGLDTKTGKPDVADGPPAAVTRSSSGTWNLGTLAPKPLSRVLDDRQHGTTFTLVGGAF